MLQMAQKRELSIKNESDPYEDQFAEVRFSNSTDKRLILAKSQPFGRLMYSLDAYKFLGNGYTAISSVRALNKNNIQETVSDYETYLNGVRYRSDREIPKEAGFCIANGFIANDGKVSQVENANLYFKLKKNPDVAIRISSDVYFKKEKGLIERGKEATAKQPAEWTTKIKVIKEGERIVNGRKGEEHLESFPSDDKMGTAHLLAWETLGEIGNPLTPGLSLRIYTGEGGAGETLSSSISTQEVVAIYEAVIKSIRVRPVTGTQ
jgi:hypothetical protein